MAITTTTLIIAAAAISAASTLKQGQAAKEQADFQAAVQRQQAEREREIAAAQEDDFRRQQDRLMGSRQARLGGSGVVPSTGSPLLASEDLAGETEAQSLRIRAGGEAASTRLQQQALLATAQGDAARTASFFEAGSTLLSGLNKAGVFDRKTPPTP